MGVPREGTMHQAGSDSMLTIQTFFKMFNNLQTTRDKNDYKECYEIYNQDVYGYSNDQAFRNMATVFNLQQDQAPDEFNYVQPDGSNGQFPNPNNPNNFVDNQAFFH